MLNRTLSVLSDRQPPRYAMGQMVYVTCEVESGRWEAFGVITGLLLDPPEWKEPGWYYQVAFYYTAVGDRTCPNYVDICSESEIYTALPIPTC